MALRLALGLGGLVIAGLITLALYAQTRTPETSRIETTVPDDALSR